MQTRVSLAWLAVGLVQVPMLAAYGMQLSAIPAFEWLPWIVLLAFAGFLMFRWNRQTALPTSLLALFLTLSGLCVACVSAALNLPWLSGFGLLLTASGFLSAHTDHSGRPLTDGTPLLFFLVLPVLDGQLGITDPLGGALIDVSHRVLQYLRLPHIRYASAIGLPGIRLYPEQMLLGYLGWPVFFSAAMLHSVLFRRPPSVLLLNAFSACAACCCYHLLSIVIIARRLNDSTTDVGFSGYQTALQVVAAIVAWLLFLSAERGIRGVFAPIDDDLLEGQRVNPLIELWNQGLSVVRGKRGSRSRRERTTWQPALIALPVLLIATCGTQLLQVTRVVSTKTSDSHWLPVSQLEQAVQANGANVDYRPAISAKDVVFGRGGDNWTFYQANRITELAISVRPQPWSSVKEQYLKKGWTEVPPLEHTSAPTATDRMMAARFQRNTDYAMLCYSNVDAEGQANVAPNLQQPSYQTIRAFTVVQHELNGPSTQQLYDEFSSVLQRIEQDNASVTSQ